MDFVELFWKDDKGEDRFLEQVRDENSVSDGVISFGLWLIFGLQREPLHSSIVIINPTFFNNFMSKERKPYSPRMISAIKGLRNKDVFIFLLCVSSHWALATVVKTKDDDMFKEYIRISIDSLYDLQSHLDLFKDCISSMNDFLNLVHRCDEDNDKGASDNIISSSSCCLETDIIHERLQSFPIVVLGSKNFSGESPVINNFKKL